MADQGRQYLQERESIQLGNRKRRAVIGGLAALFVFCCAGGLVFGSESRARRALESVHLFKAAQDAVKDHHSKACVYEIALSHMGWVKHECGSTCRSAAAAPAAPAATASRDPSPHAACLKGCTSGGNAAVRLGCSAVISDASCAARTRAACGAEHCGEFSGKGGAAAGKALRAACLEGCEAVAAAACRKAVKQLARKRLEAGEAHHPPFEEL